MRIQLNGKEKQVPSDLQNIEELLKHLLLADRIVVVEHNNQVLTKELHAKTKLSDGDRIEIVHFVGGG
ncbi:sulfur carrier protein ThiS [Thermoactinomyces mirandus]|uniref:Sulfur carrier protein ThiS n=1 Tax=Thermoactinomyces mirandus TaxID=2756294 RepID=A0A7W2AS69_9BACL|nr:sulfur carrier protein ThiS [Thermoactinomyces mirandus]MBA4603127.1 sulfur carrier protein ThiS [Thermoactinomyces mirandus]